MKTTEVTIKRNFVYNPLDMEHLHVSVTKTVMEGEDGKDVLQAALKEVEDFYLEVCKNNNKGKQLIQKEFNEAPYFNEKDSMPPVPLMQELEECDNLEILKSYRFTHKTVEEQRCYDEKLETLTKKQK